MMESAVEGARWMVRWRMKGGGCGGGWRVDGVVEDEERMVRWRVEGGWCGGG